MIRAIPTVKPSMTGSGTSAIKRPALTQPRCDEDYARQKRTGKQEAVVAKLADYSRNDDDERAKWGRRSEPCSRPATK